MATTGKSIIYAWPSQLTSSTQADPASFATASFGSKTLYFPETSSRVFKSVYAEISWHDNSTTGGGSIGEIKVQLKISGSNNNSIYSGGPYNNAGATTGESISFVGGPFNFTNFFNTYVPSNSSSIDIEAFSYVEDTTGFIMQNPTFKLYCTYEHDDIDTTYIKTAIIPLESSGSVLSTTFPGIIGNQQIPRLITSQSLNTTQVQNNTAFTEVSASIYRVARFTGSYEITQTGSYRIYGLTSYVDSGPTYLSASIYASSSNTLLFTASSPGPSLNYDQYVSFTEDLIPTKIRYDFEGDAGFSSVDADINLSQSVVLPGFLPESNVNIRDYFIEIEGNELYGNASTAIALTGSITSSFSNLQNRFNPITSDLRSDTYDRLIWSVPTSSLPNVSQSHNFGLRSNIANIYEHLPINLYVTYEYNKTTTTQVNNTILLGWNLNAPLDLGGLSFDASANVALNKFIIPENNPVLQQSALRVQWADTSTITAAFVRVGSQNTNTSYTDGGTQLCGMKSLQHRFDISASNPNASDSNVILQKGINYITSSFFVQSTTIPSTNTNGYFIINYKADTHPTKGVDGCSRFYYFNNREFSTSDISSPQYTTSSFNYNLSNSSSLYIVDNLYNYMSFERNATTLLNLGIQYTGSEASPTQTVYPKETIWRNTITSDPEAGSFITVVSTQNIFKDYQASPKSYLMDPFVSRNYVNLYDSPTATVQYSIYGTTNTLVAHSYTFDFTGSIYNYVGDGSGIPVTIYQSGSTEAILQLTSTVGGKFSGTWFDDSTPIFASIDYQDKFGKSKQSIVTGSFDVYLTPFEYGYSSM